MEKAKIIEDDPRVGKRARGGDVTGVIQYVFLMGTNSLRFTTQKAAEGQEDCPSKKSPF